MSAPLPEGVRARVLPGINGLDMHVLEAGAEAGRPLVLLLHGFPELAYSWRKIMPGLAAAGYHVVAPDQRGYGRTTGWERAYDGDLTRFGLLNLVRDALALLHALGQPRVAAVVGHDFGAAVAAYCALARPDVFPAVALMSAPFAGAPAVSGAPDGAIHAALAALDPPRKHYQWYYTTRAANLDMWRAPQGVHDFLRAYYHHKSADWAANQPAPLAGWNAPELAKLPRYYVMDRDQDMAATVAREMPSAAAIAANRWLPEAELRVYSEAFARTGFQGGLNWYRARSAPKLAAELALFAGRPITVPACFIAGAQDWGVFQKPGDLETMQTTACTRLLGCHLLPGAGHWVQQEQPAAVLETLLAFLSRVAEGV